MTVQHLKVKKDRDIRLGYPERDLLYNVIDSPIVLE